MEYLCGTFCCVRCAGLSLVCTSQGHGHLLHHYHEYDPKYCNACGVSTGGFPIYRCRGCNLMCIGNALTFHKQLGTSVMNICSL
ncbi:hypothetical protein PTKIN_Ptkin16aG0009000 [Pterospermum kingtungense]